MTAGLTDAEIERLHAEGAEAAIQAMAGHKVGLNPYPPGSEEAGFWSDGFHAACSEDRPRHER